MSPPHSAPTLRMDGISCDFFIFEKSHRRVERSPSRFPGQTVFTTLQARHDSTLFFLRACKGTQGQNEAKTPEETTTTTTIERRRRRRRTEAKRDAHPSQTEAKEKSNPQQPLLVKHLVEMVVVVGARRATQGSPAVRERATSQARRLKQKAVQTPF